MNNRSLIRGLSIAGALACATLVASQGVAGWAPIAQVKITDQGIIGGHAEGKVGDAHNSEDTMQLIGCGLRATAAGTVQVNCWATDATGLQRGCNTTEPGMITVAGSVGSDSYVSFAWVPSGKCTAIEVQNGSFMNPKKWEAP